MTRMNKYEYYYKVNKCKVTNARDGNCICWHEEGTGPFKDESRKDPVDIVHWRIKQESLKGND